MCEQTAAHSKKSKGDTATVKKMEDCAKMCRTSADFIKRDSEQSAKVCAVCQDLCNTCAESCEKSTDAKLKACADECRNCADHCKKMAG
jgi:hypothetical protein